jgi:hypothetical protein
VLQDAGVRGCTAVIWMSYLSRDRINLAFIVPDGIPDEELRRLLVTLGASNRTVNRLLMNEATGKGELFYVRAVFPSVASESMWRCWRELWPFHGVAVAATGQTLVGFAQGAHALPSLASLTRGAEVHYASLLPLKNNWRLSRGRPGGRSYAEFVNHAKGYASAFKGPVVTVPEALEFTSTEAGYVAAIDALEELRTRVRAGRAGQDAESEPLHA